MDDAELPPLRVADAAAMLAGRVPAAVAAAALPGQGTGNTVRHDALYEFRETRTVRVTDEDMRNQLEILGVSIEDRVAAEEELLEFERAYAALLHGYAIELAEGAARRDPPPDDAGTAEHPPGEVPQYHGKFSVRVRVNLFGRRWKVRVGRSRNAVVTLRYVAEAVVTPAAGGSRDPTSFVVPVWTGACDSRRLSLAPDTYYAAASGETFVRSSALGHVLLARAPDAPGGEWRVADAAEVYPPERLPPNPDADRLARLASSLGAEEPGGAHDSGARRRPRADRRPSVLSTVSCGQLPPGATADVAPFTLYVAAGRGSHAVYVVESDGRMLRTVQLSHEARGLVVTPNGTLYAGSQGNQVSRVGLAQAAAPTKFRSHSSCAGMAVDAKGNLYVASGNNSVLVYAAGGGDAPPRTLVRGKVPDPGALAVTEDGTLLVAANGDGSVKMFTLAGQIIGRLITGCSRQCALATRGPDTVLVASYNQDCGARKGPWQAPGGHESGGDSSASLTASKTAGGGGRRMSMAASMAAARVRAGVESDSDGDGDGGSGGEDNELFGGRAASIRVHTFSRGTGEILSVFETPRVSCPGGVAFLPDGRVAVGTRGCVVLLFSGADGSPCGSFLATRPDSALSAALAVGPLLPARADPAALFP